MKSMSVIKRLKALSARRKREAFFLAREAVKEVCDERKNVEENKKR